MGKLVGHIVSENSRLFEQIPLISFTLIKVKILISFSVGKRMRIQKREREMKGRKEGSKQAKEGGKGGREEGREGGKEGGMQVAKARQ